MSIKSKKIQFLFLWVAMTISYLASAGQYRIGAEIGYRQDHIDWDIKGGILNATEKSSLDFDKLHCALFRIEGKALEKNCYYGRFSGDIGWICHGVCQEKFSFPTSADPSIIQTNQAINTLTGNNIWDVEVGLGYPINMCGCDLMIAPIVGYGYQMMKIVVNDCHKVFVNTDKCHSEYWFKWYGPWLGIDVNYYCDSCLNLYSEFEYHHLTSKRVRDSHIGEGFFDRFHHEDCDDSWGIVATCGGNFYVYCDWFVGAYVKYRYFTSEKHCDDVCWQSIGTGVQSGFVF